MFRLAMCLLCFCSPLPGFATSIETIYLDDPDSGQGFYDTTPVPPAPGNPGTTLGEQRRNVHEYGVRLLERIVWIDNKVPVISEAGFEHQEGSVATGSPNWFYDRENPRFSNVPSMLFAARAYPVSQWTEGRTVGLNTHYDLDYTWDYTIGESLATPVSYNAMVSTTLHEFGHGLGFASLAGNFVFDLSVFDRYIRHHGATPAAPVDMTDEQREALARAGDDARWVGPVTSEAAGRILTAGQDRGEVFLDARGRDQHPMSHLSDTLLPHQLMQSSGAATIELGIAAYMFSDMGYGPVVDSSVTMAAPDPSKVRVEVSTDAPAENLLVNLHLPDGVTVESVLAAPATCNLAAQPVECRYTTLSGTASIEYTLSGDPGAYHVKADVDHQAPHVDGAPVNNFASTQVEFGSNTITAVALAPGQVIEAVAAGTSVGRFQVTGTAGVDHTFTLIDGGQHNACFRIEGDQLLTTTPLDYEALSRLDIRVETRAGNGFIRQDYFQVRVTPMTDVGAAFLSPLPNTTYAGNPGATTHDLRRLAMQLLAPTIESCK